MRHLMGEEWPAGNCVAGRVSGGGEGGGINVEAKVEGIVRIKRR